MLLISLEHSLSPLINYLINSLITAKSINP